MAKQKRFRFTLLAALFVLLLSLAQFRLQAQTPEPEITLEALGNTTYLSEFAQRGQVTLENGQYEDETSRIFVALTGYAAYGDLTGDGVEDAAVVLVTNGGGSGNFYELALVVDEAGTLTNTTTTLLGDRIQIHNLSIMDGQITIDMTTQGPEDAMCCPTLNVQHVYELTAGELTLASSAEETLHNVEGAFTPDADPTAAMLFLGGDDYYWLDPTLVSVHSGAVTGPGVEANTLGAGCAGTVDERPDVVLHWRTDETVDTLRLFFLSMGDPTIVVVTPNGDVVCNDDLNPLVLDPYLEFENPAPGRYAVYIGSFEGKATTPGFLVATGQDYSPATMEIAQMFPRQIIPGAVGEPLPVDVLQVDATPAAEMPAEPIAPETDPYTKTLVAGGELGAYEIDLDNDLCTGFIDPVPTFAFDWVGEAEKLSLFFEGDADTTLVLRDPNGAFQCNDDFDGAYNLNPYLDLTPIDGSYQLWVGSFAPSTLVTGTITIATTGNLQPTPLTSEASSNE